MSLPVRECGLKYKHTDTVSKRCIVTPCAGVWIEIESVTEKIIKVLVTPCAGVWIEIRDSLSITTWLLSLPVRECGLKSPSPPCL